MFFKPFEIPKTYNFEYKIDLLQEIQQRLRTLDQSEITQQVPDTSQQSHQSSRTINMMNQQTESEQNSETEQEINKIEWKQPQRLYYPKATAPDIVLEEKPNF